MSIEFSGLNYIDFGSIVNNQTVRTVSAWVYADDITSSIDTVVYHTGGGWFLKVESESTYDYISFAQTFSTNSGVWHSEINVIPISSWTHIVVTYDGSSALNNPTFYVDGVQIGNTEISTPSGTMGDDSDGFLYIGGQPFDLNEAMDGKIEDPRIYNRILSQAEITELYQVRMVRSISSGLVFHPVFCGAKRLSKFDGVTLGAANTIVDDISGAIGVPSGNPIGRGNTIQRIY